MKYDKIQLAHGGGGRLSAELIDSEIVTRFGSGALKDLPDAASISLSSTSIVFTTDSFVVQPHEFPGGNIGDLAVHGTVNDISVAGGRPVCLSLALILEEGFPIAELRKILDSIKKCIDRCGVKIVTGDTKVVAKGQCDGIYINTAGIGEAYPDFKLDRETIVPGDKVLTSGTLGDHGLAVMTAREKISIENGPVSDTASVQNLVSSIREFGRSVRFMRDPTRGGAAAVLNETVSGRKFGILLEEKGIPLSSGTKAVSEMLGLDPLNSPSEGRLLLVCDGSVAGKIVEKWRKMPEGRSASVIGTVTADKAGKVLYRTAGGGVRLVDVPSGEMLPRIC